MIRLVAFSLFMLTLVSGASLSASATTILLSATINGGQEVPTNESSGTGTASIAFETSNNVIEWTIDFQGLTSQLIAAHFHNAPVGANGGVILDILGNSTVVLSADGTSGQLIGRAIVPEDQVQNLLNGDWYVNLHTREFGAGEIRGQVGGEVVPEPTTALLVGAGALMLAARTRRSLR